jgi:chaperonin GroES
MKPLEDRVILEKPKKDETVTATGLVLQNNEDAVNNQATVVAVGEGYLTPKGVRLEMPVKVGDKVAFNPMAVQAMTYEGKDYMVIFTKDILAIIEENDD